MLLTKTQVSEHWDGLREAILSSLPPDAPRDVDAGSRILKGLMEGQLQCWVLQGKADGGVSIGAVSVTRLLQDPITGSKHVLILSLYGYRRMPTEAWRVGRDTLMDFARSRGAQGVLAYTQSARVEELAKDLGGARYFTMVRWEA